MGSGPRAGAGFDASAPSSPGGERGRGRGREEQGPRGFEGSALSTARELDKPLLAVDFAAQLPILERFATEAHKARIRSIDQLPFDTRAKLLTILLRVMRQTVVEDPEKEAARKKVHATLGQVWKALGDDRRAGLALIEAGAAKAAAHLLAHTGEWDAVAALHERDGRFLEAAKLHEQHGQKAEAARLYAAGGDSKKAIALHAEAGDLAAVQAVAMKLPIPDAKAALLALGAGDLLMDLLAKKGRWEDVARLYERAEQWADAGRAWERAAKTHKAILSYDRGGEPANADRLIEAEAQDRASRGDPVGAAAIWARFGRWQKASEVAPDPEHAYRWLEESGDQERAVALARREAVAAVAAEEPGKAAVWLRRAGDLLEAATAFEEAELFADAARVHEALHDWPAAARCYEAAGELEPALELYERAGDQAGVARIRVASFWAPAPERPAT